MIAFETEPLLFSSTVAPDEALVKISVDPLPAEMVRTTLPLSSVNFLSTRLADGVPLITNAKSHAEPAGSVSSKGSAARAGAADAPAARVAMRIVAAAPMGRRAGDGIDFPRELQSASLLLKNRENDARQLQELDEMSGSQ